MTGEGQLFLYGEDAYSHASLTLRRLVTRQDEGGLGKIHLLGDGLHFLIVEAASVGKNSQRVALERPGGENVELNKRKTAKLGIHAGFIVPPGVKGKLLEVRIPMLVCDLLLFDAPRTLGRISSVGGIA